MTGFAKLEHQPGGAFMKLFVDACTASELKRFEPQGLANIINGEEKGTSDMQDMWSSVPSRDRGDAYDRLCEARAPTWRGLHEAVRGHLHGERAEGLRSSGAGQHSPW
jgi:hypothetical protein